MKNSSALESAKKIANSLGAQVVASNPDLTVSLNDEAKEQRLILELKNIGWNYIHKNH